jgi:hypothetical protein
MQSGFNRIAMEVRNRYVIMAGLITGSGEYDPKPYRQRGVERMGGMNLRRQGRIETGLKSCKRREHT